MPPSICVRNAVFALVQSVSGQAGWLICFWHTFYYLLHHENMIRKIIYGVYAILGMMTMAACSGQSDASEISLEKMHGFPTENTWFS